VGSGLAGAARVRNRGASWRERAGAFFRRFNRIALGLTLLFCSCSSSAGGEIGPMACTNGRDDDHDGLIDCADPDCLNLDLCRDAGRVVSDAGRNMSDAGPTDAAVTKPPRMDSGVIKVPVFDSGANGDDDGGPASVDAGPVDAGPPPPTCKPKCAATEACVDLKCQPVTASTSQTIAVTVVSVRAANADPFSACYDGDCLQPSWGLCCPIDPYVRVVQIHADGSPDTVVGQTATTMDSPRVDYTDAPTWTVSLAQGDLLVVQVWDHNVEVDDSEIFECKPNLTKLVGGQQTCGDRRGPFYAPLTVTVDLEPKK
jgi:hypothetical protein